MASDADRELPTETWLRVIGAARRLNTLAISFTGGEPLLRPDVYELVRRCRELGMQSHLCSNAILLDEEAARRLAQAGLTSISLSLDGPTAELHNLQRGRDCFNGMVEAARTLRRVAPGIRMGFNYVLNKHNYRHTREAVRLARELGASGIRFAPIHTNLDHRGQPLAPLREMRLDASAMRRLKRELAELGRMAASETMHRNSRLFLDLTPTAMCRRVPFNCFAGYASCAVDPYGYVAPCPDIDSELNVRDRPLDAIWFSPEFSRLRRGVRRCRTACWDSTYGEMALRFTVRSFLRDPLLVLKEAAFYLGGRSS